MMKVQKEKFDKNQKIKTHESQTTEKNLDLIRKLIEENENNLLKIKHLLFTKEFNKKINELNIYENKDGKVIEGIFDGENMISRDNKKYPVPANYASKSKLVSGDLLKLTILSNGSFIFKQIGPVERRKLVGELTESNGRYYINADGKRYNVLLASVTYFKIKTGDKVTIVVPKNQESDWATIENVIDKK